MPANIRYRAADGATILAGSTKDLGQVVASPSAEVDTTSIKVTVENVGDRVVGVSPFASVVLRREQIGSGDGYTFGFSATDPNGTISKAWGAGVDGGGVLNGAPLAADAGADPYADWAPSGGAGVYGVVIVAKNSTGKTIASVEVSFNVSDTGHLWQYTWVQTPGATGYEVHRTPTPGTYGASTLVAVIGSGATVTYLDDGDAPTTGTPPLVNTTGGAGPTYGTAPSVGSHTSADKTIATAGGGGLAVGQQWFFWLIAKIPAGATSIGNKRSWRFIPKEV